MTGSPKRPDEIAAVVRDAGLLLQSDPRAPSAVGMLAGGPVSGSWWGRPDGKTIFHGLGALEDDADIALFKLLNGKATFVHRRLWPALAAVGRAQDPWQMEGLADQERQALLRVEAAGEVPALSLPGAKGGAAARLEARLLVCARQVHTAGGVHAKILTAWGRWLDLKGAEAGASVASAQRQIDEAVAALYAGSPRPRDALAGDTMILAGFPAPQPRRSNAVQVKA